MDIEALNIDGVVLLHPKNLEDNRGSFCETFRASWFGGGDAGKLVFCQDNQSYSKRKGTLRGLHFQTGPSVQAKLVRCVRGAIFDVAVDLRTGSPTFGQYVSAELSAANGVQILIPHGFAHAYLTLSPDTIVLYKTDNYYDKDREGAVIWSDPDITIDWPGKPGEVFLSDKDKTAPLLSELPDYFIYDESQAFNVRCVDI
ncbi:dTDP-4-dehydrorhamnose 3,5-epimerase [bacterium AH-315-J19]|nr:dTDP-4-dehydrorhamnose 3,5-epimerase [Robiginitomaculum sp.]MBN4058446.1 dTDP-4-dehydrorhamnose 3,5-epimerase [bacterium AH-315-J19]